MKTNYTPGLSVNPPIHVIDAAEVVSNYMKKHGYKHWQLLDVCSRNFAEDRTALVELAQQMSRGACLQQVVGTECVCWTCKARAVLARVEGEAT